MANLIVIGILIVLLGAAIRTLVKAKKRGVKCIGCSAMCCCTAKKSCCGGGEVNSAAFKRGKTFF